MGTSIELKVGEVSLDYSKNHMGIDYGYLFQKEDEGRRKSDQISYEYFKEHPNEATLIECETGFMRPLSRVLPRLQLLGYSLNSARAEYQAVIEDILEIDGDDSSSEVLPFDEFCALVCKYPLSSLHNDYIDSDTPEREKISQGRFADEKKKFDRLPCDGDSECYWSESSLISAKMCFLSVPSMLQIFGLNPANANTEVAWQFGPLVNAGWVSRDFFHPGARRRQAILIATEGSSDTRIIKRAMDFIHPDISDFFRFIDIDEKHHFWGTGNLVKFTESLLRVDIQNKILILLDNDAEGVGAYRKLEKLKLPVNMRSMLLPHLDEFKKFPTIGPEGTKKSDINGRAVAIECYLDLRIPNQPPAMVRWSNYKKDIDSWQGALEHKDSYMKYFLEQSKEAIIKDGYDSSKLSKLLREVITEASHLSAPE